MRKLTVRIAIGIAVCAAVSAAVIAGLQQPFPPAEFEFQQFRPHMGYLLLEPFPILVKGRAMVPLVAPGKHGAETLFPNMHGSWISLSAARIHRGADEMLEVVPESIQRSSFRDSGAVPPTEPLGEVALSGEIVDSKCYLGVMNPGSGRVHRECAIRCISGGVPPVFIAVDDRGKSHSLWLTGAHGEPLSKRILDYVAEPVRVNGRLARQGNLTYFRIDLSSLRRE
ncbi:MAG: hypothetical protein ACKV2U_26480 [Bryobacteraceae bacterium]